MDSDRTCTHGIRICGGPFFELTASLSTPLKRSQNRRSIAATSLRLYSVRDLRTAAEQVYLTIVTTAVADLAGSATLIPFTCTVFGAGTELGAR